MKDDFLNYHLIIFHILLHFKGMKKQNQMSTVNYLYIF